MVYSDAIGASTAYNNARRLLRDPYGKLLLVTRSWSPSQALHASWSNDGGTNWSNLTVSCSGCDGPTWALDSSDALHLVYAIPGQGIYYRRFQVSRQAGTNDILSLTQTAGPLQLFASASAARPSLALDAFGRPAIARVEQGGPSFAVRSLRAEADPSVSTKWKGVNGSSLRPDTLRSASTTLGSANPARCPTKAHSVYHWGANPVARTTGLQGDTMFTRASLPLFTSIVLVLAAACAPAAPSPTTAPAKPAATTAPARPAATSAPAKTEAKPAASPAAKAEAKPAASPAVKPAAAKATKAADITIPKPSGDLTVRAGFSSEISFNDLPLWITAQRLSKQGWKTDTVEFAQTELSTEALSKGDVVFGTGATSSALLANQKGAPIVLVADQNLNHWVLVSTPAITKCTDLNGKRLAIHSQGAVSTAMVKIWVDRTCKGTNPNYVVIAGSQNRAAALINGQIDSTPLEMADWVSIENDQSGKFRMLENFSKGLPDLSTTGAYVNANWATKSKDVAVAFVAELLKTNRMIAEDPTVIDAAAKTNLPELNDKVRPKVIESYNSFNAFPPNGGLTKSKVEGTIKFFTEGGVLQPGLTADKAANLSIVQGALALIGEVPGKP